MNPFKHPSPFQMRLLYALAWLLMVGDHIRCFFTREYTGPIQSFSEFKAENDLIAWLEEEREEKLINRG